MAKLDRAIQRSILENLAQVYPGIAHIHPSDGETEEDVSANLYYLWQHGLIDAQWTLTHANRRHNGAPAITAKGMDFLADDGGLSAILGVVTVKLHDDTIRQLLVSKIEKAQGDKSVKDHLIAKVKELPADALGALTMTGLDAALDQAPNVISLLRGWLKV